MDAITPRNLLVTCSATFLLGGFVSWGLFFGWRCSAGAKPFDAPAWVQAVGSVLAILVAIAVPAWQRAHQRSDERRDAQRRARSLASSLLTATKLLLEDAEATREAAKQNAAGSSEGVRLIMKVPPQLKEVERDLHLLGVPGDHLLGAIYYSSIANDQVEHDGYLWRDKLPEFTAAMDRVVIESVAALNGMHSLLR